MLKKLLAYLLMLSILFVTSCKKEDATDVIPPVVNDTVSVLNKNVVIIDTTALVLTSDSSDLVLGKYKFIIVRNVPDFKANDVIVGESRGGYIRKVQSINMQGGVLTLETTQGNMEDVFNTTGFDFTLDTENLTAGKGFTLPLNNILLYQNGPVSINLDKGSVNLTGDWNFGFDFKKSKLDTFELSSENLGYDSHFEITVKASVAESLPEKVGSFKKVKKTFIKYVPIIGPIVIPVVVEMEIDFRYRYSGSIGGSLEQSVVVDSKNSMNIGVKYRNGQWENSYNNTATATVDPQELIGRVNAEVNLSVEPIISFKLYKIVGPYATVGLMENAKLRAKALSTSVDWDFNINIWTQAAIGVNASILGKSLFDYKKEWKSDSLSYTTPFKLERISGDNQKGEPEKYLSQPLKIKVLDIEGNPETNAYVYFDVKKGGGSLEQGIVQTNQDGEASVRWKLGKVLTEIQTVEGIVKNSDGSLIGGSPVEFAAIAGIDTQAILVSHGVWKATEGIFEDVAFGTFGKVEIWDACDGTDVKGQQAIDEISLIFGNSSGANITSKGRFKGDIVTSTNPCVITVGEKNISSSAGFEWTYLAELKKIRATSITDDGFFDMSKGEYFDFTILSFSETAMEITGTPPGYGTLHLKLK